MVVDQDSWEKRDKLFKAFLGEIEEPSLWGSGIARASFGIAHFTLPSSQFVPLRGEAAWGLTSNEACPVCSAE
jgi:hypothetical protein